MSRTRRMVGAGVWTALLLACALANIAVPAAAHGSKTVGGLTIRVGWGVEPAYLDVLNTLVIVIEANGTGGPTPVEGAESSLVATLSTGPTSRIIAMVPSDEAPGTYVITFIPTREGRYHLNLQGTVGSTAVDLTFDPEEVEDPTAAQFPEKDPSTMDLHQRISALEGANAQLQMIAIVAVLLAVLGLAVGAAGMRRRGTAIASDGSDPDDGGDGDDDEDGDRKK